MKPIDHHPLKISASAHKKTLSKEQKRFNQLIAKIDENKKKLEEMKASVAAFRLLFSAEYLPAMDVFKQESRRFIVLADKIASKGKLNQYERRVLTQIIEMFCHQNLEKEGDAELKEIYSRWCDADFDEEYEEQRLLAQEFLREQMMAEFGLELPEDFDVDDPEGTFEKMAAQMRELMDGEESLPPEPERKKTAKQIAKEERLEQAEKEVSMSIREVYRKLASALHPDREMDETVRAEKTALMQKVNMAYEARDLLQLLALQMELEHIDQAHLEGLSEKKLKHYVQILADQERELRDEIDYVTEHFYAEFNPPAEGNMKMQIKNLKADIAHMQKMTKHMADDNKNCRNIKDLKAILAGQVGVRMSLQDSLF